MASSAIRTSTQKLVTRVNTLTQHCQPFTPRKRALLIGICYGKKKDSGGLLRPHSDVDEWKAFLVKKCGYHEEDVLVMKDDDKTDPGSKSYPNYANIMRVLQEEFIIQGERDVDYFFLYSGHSGQAPCFDGTEEDGKNELIIPVDAINKETKETTHECTILDDFLKKALVQSLPPRCRLKAVLDTCHSGTLMDLYHFRCNRVISLSSNIRRIQRKCIELWSRLEECHPNNTAALSQALKYANQICTAVVPPSLKARTCTGLCQRSRTTRPDVVCISACRDSESAWEQEGSDISVAKAMLEHLREEPEPTYKDLMRAIADKLQAQNIELAKYKSTSTESKTRQNPEICSEVPLRMKDKLRL